MQAGYCLILALALTGCATQHRPGYDQTVTDFTPDCANRESQIRYFTKLKRFPAKSSDEVELYNSTINLQIQRLNWYCS